MTAHTIRYSFDRPFIQRAIRRDMLERGLWALLFIAIGTAGVEVLQGAFSWYTTTIGLVGCVLIMGLVLFMTRVHAKRIDAFWRRLAPDGFITWELEDDGFEVVTGSSRARYPWAGLRRLWRYDDVWIVEIVKRYSVFLPPEQIVDDAREFIVERCRDAGVRT